ncbi:MAG: hypothetical protein KVP17_002881 [Porospora cf. gigantea B]|uniref:uncharacterized protein n=1 Tax=Porospora cf. gigantea B TaxID=2853592 RepID=UPI003571B0B5|nr:MAG: hypothetical protein KVP17_002881 [Porospora cf. gigantea B]
MVRIIPLKTPSALGHDPLNHPLDGRVLEVLGEPGYGQLPPVGAKVVVTEEDGVEVHDIRQFVKDPEVLPSTHLHLKGSCRGLDRGSFLSQLGILQPDMVSRIRHLTTLTCLAKYLLMEESVYSTLDLFRTQLWPKVVSRPFPQEVISPLEDLDSFLPWFVQHLEGRVLHTELSLERLVLNTTWIAGCCRLLVVGLPRLASSQAYLTFLLQALGETESSSSCEGVESLRRQLGITNCYAVGMPSPVTSALPRKPPPPERAASSDSFLEAFTGRLGTPNARARKVVRRTARADVRSDAGRRGSLVVVEFDGPEAARKLWDRLTQGYAHFSGRRLFAFADPVGLVSVTERLCPRLSSGLASRPPQSAPNAQLTVYLPRVSQDCMAALK